MTPDRGSSIELTRQPSEWLIRHGISYLNRELKEGRLPHLMRRDVIEESAASKWYLDQTVGRAYRAIAYIPLPNTPSNRTGKVVGMAYVQRLHGRGYRTGTLGVTVAEANRRSGLGSELANAVIDMAAASHLLRIESFPFESNIGAIEMLESLGFRNEGVLRNRVETNAGNIESCVVMGLVLG